MNKAFTLVELSIVLVIIGLLTAGILAVQSLIRAAELRSVITEREQLQTAMNAFRDKYLALPGDMTNATDFWGIAAGSAGNDVTCRSASSTTTATCDGDGDRNLDNYYEGFHFFKHLSNADLIEGSYTGLSSEGYNGDGTIGGENALKSGLTGATWFIYDFADSGDSVRYATTYGGGTLSLGGELNNNVPYGKILTISDAWNIDTKIDDGQPGTGTLIVTYWNDCTLAANNSDLSAEYDLANGDDVQCSFAFPKFFK